MDQYNEHIISVREHPEYLECAIDYFSSKWGIERAIYEDCIGHSITTKNPLPRWYLMLDGENIIGSFGLITNDFVSRQDLWPWLCALYVESSQRGRGLGGRLLAHGRREAARLGFESLYLVTDHVGYYERYGWRYIGQGYGPSGESRIYETESGD